MTTLVARDYRGALEFLRAAYENEEPAPFPTLVLDALRRLIPSSIASYREWDDRSGSYAHWTSGVDLEDVERIWDRYPAVRSQDPLPGVCPRGEARVPTGRAFQLSDFLPLQRFRRLELYRDVCRPVGTNYVMKLFLPLEGRSGGFVLESERHDFTPRDRGVLDLVAPHLVLVWRAKQAEASASEESDAFLTLTLRERQVLRLVAGGLTNREVALALVVAPGTVRKHLDNVYRKLSVRGRAEAVAVTRVTHSPARTDAQAAMKPGSKRGL